MIPTKATQLKEHLSSYFHNHFGVVPLQESQQSIEQWFTSPLGQRILDAEQKQLNQFLPKIYGYHLMQLSVLKDYKLSEQSPVTHHFSLGIQQNESSGALAEYEKLPIDADSIDAAILHHVLEYSTHPHQLLRETARTIIPNGFIVVVGFNPLSFLNFKKQVARVCLRGLHWRYRSLQRGRVIDWLRILDFEPVYIKQGDFGLPFNRGRRQWVERMGEKFFSRCGNFYIIVARKSITPMTIVRKPWRSVTRLPVLAKRPTVNYQPQIENTQIVAKKK